MHQFTQEAADPVWITLFAATAGVIGALFGAFVSAWATARRDHLSRHHESQRAALYALQDGALELRRALQVYGRSGPTPQNTQSMDDAHGRLDLLMHRIEDHDVREDADQWRDLAQRFFLDDPDITVTVEDTAWQRVHHAIGLALRATY